MLDPRFDKSFSILFLFLKVVEFFEEQIHDSFKFAIKVFQIIVFVLLLKSTPRKKD
jgi:hypothetical protein